MVQNKTNYSKLADYYDLIYSISPPNDGIFYKKYIKKNTEVLEMGIGTGRVFLDFFDLGVKWTGIDYSEEMIEKCKEKIEPLQPLKEKINLITLISILIAMFGVFLAQKLNNFPLTIVGNGKQKRDFTYVSDIVDVFYKCLFYNGKRNYK